MRSSTTARTARRRTLHVAAAALTAAAALALTACSGSDATGAKPASSADTGKAAAESGGTGSSAGGAKEDGKTDARTDAKTGAAGKQSGGTHAADTAKAGSGIERCHTSGLKASFAMGGDAAPDPNAGGATTTSIVLTNKGNRDCTIGGFPGVDLKSENGGQVWSLLRSSAKHGSITLGPGDSTDFTISLGMAQKNEEHTWMPASVAVTPPNETTALTVKWPWGPLVDQTGATHPATFVNPIG
ncbi:DUF4232 domain-containing protein [Streptomyces sp. UNOC14_S4]|uniref:DUF4232 domain-containing protein n=1 Tax=Streptomyces sp. UNOC14_S4 TaxID=2872340 RepID=UPI001E389189|nr:DUF4232 domain-containing protein [Streptomyces sp. UNOC14_S4]MCC3769126.1 DUF4232 domain-containing protein [Streptomyces sp. UNOC14_S4]